MVAQEPTATCPRCGRAPGEKCPEDGPGLKVNTSMCPRRRIQRTLDAAFHGFTVQDADGRRVDPKDIEPA